MHARQRQQRVERDREEHAKEWLRGRKEAFRKAQHSKVLQGHLQAVERVNREVNARVACTRET